MLIHIEGLVARRALFVINHSGGKDSQLMMIELLKRGIPRSQLVVVHAALGEVEWQGALELAEKQARDAGVPFIVARARHKDGSPKDFFSMVEHNIRTKPAGTPPFPTSKYRQCTSDLKRGPIEREVIAYMKAKGFNLVINCEGIRAAESTRRAKLKPFEVRKGQLSKAGREAYNWLPIFEMPTDVILPRIRAAGQEPHPAYAENERLSCVFCIMGSKNDICHGAKARPELFAKWSALEERTGFALHMSKKTLKQLVAEAEVKAAA